MGMSVISYRKKIDTTKYKEGICRVGFFEGSRYDGNLSVAQVAYWNEFGNRAGVPKRPFMRPAIHQNRNKIVAELRSKYRQALKDNDNTMKVLERIGQKVQGLIQEQIIRTTEPANARITVEGGWMKNKQTGKPVYIKGKGFNKPLVNTGIMLASVSHQEEEIKK